MTDKEWYLGNKEIEKFTGFSDDKLRKLKKEDPSCPLTKILGTPAVHSETWNKYIRDKTERK